MSGDHEIMNHIFGPVPSRRLGRSLGIDVIPAKTCSFDCIYCESGPTTHLSVKREGFEDPAEVLRQLDNFFHLSPNGADVITFSSAGEPTLYLHLGELIAAIRRKYPSLPLIVLTNGSLLWDPAVRKDLLNASRVVPSLDAITPEIFNRINKPHPSLDPALILEGLRAFRRDYKGQLHLEIMLASGVNDSAGELAALVHAAEAIRPDKIELNTVVRPPARMGTRGLSNEQMQDAASCFPHGLAQVIGVFSGSGKNTGMGDLGSRILQTIERRPCTIPELAASLGIPEKDLEIEAHKLEEQRKLTMRSFSGRKFLCPLHAADSD
jgi:wyosine [tRNA(Phe)-imidazoG37] synthetase (radical SAM superfamily)